MKNHIFLLSLFALLFGCRKESVKKETNLVYDDKIEVVTTNYELSSTNEKSKAVLVLFGGYPESPEEVRKQFNIIKTAKENQVAVLIMNYNQKLFLEEEEKMQLSNELLSVLKKHHLPLNNIYIGGFSSGGNVSLLLSSFLVAHPEIGMKPTGVFIVDSPIDLSQLYFASEKNIARNFSKLSVQESTWIIKTLGDKFGNPHHDLSLYEQYAVYTFKSDHIKNIEFLKNTKLRFYTEPDTTWWKQNRMADYEQMNAFYIKNLAESLQAKQFKDVVYIPTENRGYRANGERHPHSWAIVDEKDLIKWMLD